MMSVFWSTLLLVSTGATGHKKSSYDVSFFGVCCYWLLQLARSLDMKSVFQSTLLLLTTGATGATVQKKSSFDVRLCSLKVLIILKFANHAGFISY